MVINACFDGLKSRWPRPDSWVEKVRCQSPLREPDAGAIYRTSKTGTAQ
ncbi:MAG: hypothetical protein R3E42_04075 [Burkholderiaceae bacterium]